MVPLPPALLPELGELEDAAAGELEVELELDLLEPHAATTSDAATSEATALMRLVLNVISFTRCAGESLRIGLLRCYPAVNRWLRLCVRSAAIR